MRRACLAVLAFLGLAVGAREAHAQQPVRDATMCADCHGSAALVRLARPTHADTVSCLTCHHIGFSNDPVVIEARRVDACVGCHQDVQATHIGVEGDTPVCTSCHTVHGDPSPAAVKGAASDGCATCHASPHPEHAAGAPDAPTCVDCHVQHSGTGFAYNDPPLLASCASCHQGVHPSHSGVEGIAECTECHSVAAPPAPDASPDPATCHSCHGTVHPAHEGVEEQPTCFACHDFAADPALAQAGPAMAQRCGVCHEEALGQLHSGGHGAFADPEHLGDLPSCLSCHQTHADMQEAADRLLVTSSIACMQCHGTSGLAVKYGLPSLVKRSYVDDFHGATLQFLMSEGGVMGDNPVMICSDCHGSHDVSTLAQEDVAEVCLRCHQEGESRLAGAWLGHAAPGPRNQPVIWLVRLFYYFLIPFMLTGLTLNILFHLRDQRRKGARVMRTEGMRRLMARLRGEKLEPQATVERFTRTERFEHLASAFIFIALVVTGLPQTRPDLGVAHAVIGALGGIWNTRLIHRILGVLFILLMVTHVTRAVMRAIRTHRLPVMIPDRKDFEDVLQTFRHYLFREPLPRVGKFDFSEKFEYWGLFLGGIVMSTTGLLLMFPELVTQYAPGVVIAAGRLMHGMEATFAVMVVILWHSYGVMLRPEVFPLDTSIFTGKMTVDRLRHEHALEYERLFPDAPGHGEEHGPTGADERDTTPPDVVPEPAPGDD